MTKRELKTRLVQIEFTQKQFFLLSRVNENVGAHYADEDEMPGYYETIVELLEEIHKLKNIDEDAVPDLEYIIDANRRMSTAIEMIKKMASENAKD